MRLIEIDEIVQEEIEDFKRKQSGLKGKPVFKFRGWKESQIKGT